MKSILFLLVLVASLPIYAQKKDTCCAWINTKDTLSVVSDYTASKVSVNFYLDTCSHGCFTVFPYRNELTPSPLPYLNWEIRLDYRKIFQIGPSLKSTTYEIPVFQDALLFDADDFYDRLDSVTLYVQQTACKVLPSTEYYRFIHELAALFYRLQASGKKQMIPIYHPIVWPNSFFSDSMHRDFRNRINVQMIHE